MPPWADNKFEPFCIRRLGHSGVHKLCKGVCKSVSWGVDIFEPGILIDWGARIVIKGPRGVNKMGYTGFDELKRRGVLKIRVLGW